MQNILLQLQDTLEEVVIILQQVINQQIMLNSPLMIMTMMFGVITVQSDLDLDLDGGTTNVLILIPITSHQCLIGQQQYHLWS